MEAVVNSQEKNSLKAEGTENVVVGGMEATDETENINVMDEVDENIENVDGLQSFAMNDEEANERENAIDPASLTIDNALVEDLSELKHSVYNAVIYGPPVGSEEAQDLENLEHYEGLLVQLCNLALHVLKTGQPQQIPSALLQQYPEDSKPLVVAYYQRICNFKSTNTDLHLQDVLEDLLERRLKEQPSPY
jgi:hypothetical protein